MALRPRVSALAVRLSPLRQWQSTRLLKALGLELKLGNVQ